MYLSHRLVLNHHQWLPVNLRSPFDPPVLTVGFVRTLLDSSALSLRRTFLFSVKPDPTRNEVSRQTAAPQIIWCLCWIFIQTVVVLAFCSYSVEQFPSSTVTCLHIHRIGYFPFRLVDLSVFLAKLGVCCRCSTRSGSPALTRVGSIFLAIVVRERKLGNGRTITPVLHDATAVAGCGIGGMLSAIHGFNTGIPFVQKHVKGPKWLPFIIGVPPLQMFSAASAAWRYSYPFISSIDISSNIQLS